MNYYEHHIGDYAAATAHLSLVEDAVYSRMLRRYYMQEGPLPADWRQVARLVGARTDDEQAAVKAVLAEFFTMADDGYRQKRADEVIAAFHEKQEGKAEERDNEADRKRRYRERRASLFEQLRGIGVVPPFDTPMDELVRMLSHGTGQGQDGDGTATQTPVTSNQSPEKQKKGRDKRATPPECPADVDPQTWTDWLLLRKAKNAPVTETVVRGARTEAGKAGMTLTAFLAVWCARGSQGLQADWLKPNERAGPQASPAKPSAAADFRGKTYDATPIDQLPPDLRAAAERALRDG